MQAKHEADGRRPSRRFEAQGKKWRADDADEHGRLRWRGNSVPGKYTKASWWLRGKWDFFLIFFLKWDYA